MEQEHLASSIAESMVLITRQTNTCPQGFSLTLSRAMLKTIRLMGVRPEDAVRLLKTHIDQQSLMMQKELN